MGLNLSDDEYDFGEGEESGESAGEEAVDGNEEDDSGDEDDGGKKLSTDWYYSIYLQLLQIHLRG